MHPRYRRKGRENAEIARERIAVLIALADFEAAKRNMARADRYIEHARNLCMKYKAPLLRSQKRRFCKYCYRYLVPGYNCTVRLRKGSAVLHCRMCGRRARTPYMKRKAHLGAKKGSD